MTPEFLVPSIHSAGALTFSVSKPLPYSFEGLGALGDFPVGVEASEHSENSYEAVINPVGSGLDPSGGTDTYVQVNGMSCPATLHSVPGDGSWHVMNTTGYPISVRFHGKNHFDARQVRGEGRGTQCIYADDGQLITDWQAGTYDHVSPYTKSGKLSPIGLFGHFIVDVVPAYLGPRK